MTGSQQSGLGSPLIRAEQPFGDRELARLYDAFPFDDDLELYREMAVEQGGDVLEVACGSGRLLVPLVRAGLRVHGIDASPAMLTLADEKLQHETPEARERARLEEADMRTFALGRRFDLALLAVKSFAYLGRRRDQQEMLACVAAHLRPGGLLVLDLLNPSPTWLLEPPGSVRQDLCATLDDGTVVMRTETVVGTDRAAQLRTVRSVYDVVSPEGNVSRRMVEWPFRYTYRFEAELLLEGAGLEVEAVHGGYRREPFTSESTVLLLVAQKPEVRKPEV